MGFSFKLIQACSQTQARAGELVTPHGTVPTPAFVPVASKGTVKTLAPQEVKELGVSILLGNAYHLYLLPGAEAIARMGGLHRFMGWERPLVTDSGGYQVFSLSPLRRISEEGVHFRSPRDGSPHFLSPEGATQLQETLGADIIMAFDQPPFYGQSWQEVKEATERTHRWAERCLKAQQSQQALFGIVQGGTFPDLREQSCKFLASLDFPGYALGGLSLGEPREVMWPMVELSVALLPTDKPRHLLGVGAPEELVEGVARGVDLFDSALPTRLARNGALFTPEGRQDITDAQFRDRDEPVEESCPCFSCRNFSAAQLHHLFKAQELLVLRLATLHNLTFITRLMAEIRQAILEGHFPQFRQDFLSRYQPTNEGLRLAQKQQRLKRWGLDPSKSTWLGNHKTTSSCLQPCRPFLV